jgi:hypothetical protein
MRKLIVMSVQLALQNWWMIDFVRMFNPIVDWGLFGHLEAIGVVLILLVIQDGVC